ncbi:Aromatic prenyltransferase DMATS type [Penicillium cinerascens]|uniref:Aromatic prenyltransferase DMATS type n=1 Tax=Penicillium cinerascens TaxID=70096 RepID=A0A9W9NFJ9_9EURO|nr:Aromatic prenyltransferase DMATS type [Penicillium cinerascens]KAJ5219030.1 Aromatic prenyltransferase DMATS type [Penicillium cinerascens]
MAQKSTASLTSAFEVLDRYCLFTNDHQRAWWEQTARLLDKVLASADYSPGRRLEALTFFSQVLIPSLGPYPFSFRSAITRSGLPLEFSVNYQQRGETGPVVRVGFEPLAAASGTEHDLYNQKPPVDFLNKLQKLGLPGYDDFLFRYFLDAHTLNSRERDQLQGKAIEGSQLTSQAAFGFDLKPEGISVKGYTFPAMKCHLGGEEFGPFVNESVKPLLAQMGPLPALDMATEYLEETKGASQFAFWSFDCVAPSQSRLKLYSSNNSVVWSKIEEIWTMGGRAKSHVVQKGLKYLEELWQLLGLSEGHHGFTGGFDDGKDSTPTPMVWNYEVKKGEPIPLTKFYFPVHGESDQRIIRGLSQFLTRIGLEKYGSSYEATVQHYL